jgi:hypothetical protein
VDKGGKISKRGGTNSTIDRSTMEMFMADEKIVDGTLIGII